MEAHAISEASAGHLRSGPRTWEGVLPTPEHSAVSLDRVVWVRKERATAEAPAVAAGRDVLDVACADGTPSTSGLID